MNTPTGLRLFELPRYEINQDYVIVRTADGAVWLVGVNIGGVIYSALQIISPLS